MTEEMKIYLKWLGYNDYEIETCKEEDVIKSNQYESFMAGYKIATENAIQWHDLRKSPNDLPKEDRYYLIHTDLGNYYISKHHCKTNYWIGIQNQYISIKNVIAWCEIPHFKE